MNQLLPHQLKILQTIKNKFGIWARPRTGKTPLAIRLATSKVKSCLIIIPNHIKEQWEREIKTWNDTDCKFYLYTKERFRIDSIDHVVNKGRRKTLIYSDKVPKCEMVCVDECHRQASNYSNKFFKTLDNYIQRHNIEYVYLLSGTPWNKNPWSVYSYGKLMGQKWDWFAWQREFFIPIRMGMRVFYKPNTAKFPKLIEILKSIGVTIRLEDVAEIAEDTEELEFLDLNAEQKKCIKNICDTTPVARYIKYSQLEQGVLKSTGYDDGLSFNCDKDNRIAELIEDEDKLIIVCHFLDQIEKYEQLAQKANRRFYTIRGGQKETASEIAKRADADENCIVFIQADCSDGYDLKSFKVMVFASMSYSFISWDQMTQRMKSMQKKEPCEYIYLLSRGATVDNAIYKSVKAGQDFSDKVFNNEIYAGK